MFLIFVPGQPTALAGLGALGHLDLDLVRVDEVVRSSHRTGLHAICLIAERRRSPLASGVKRAGSSPPSPVLLLPPMRFIAIASVVSASSQRC